VSLRSAFSDFARSNDATVDNLSALIAGWPLERIQTLLFDWEIWARDDQLPPATDQTAGSWRTWLVLGGRGAGKTRTGAEWVRGQALGKPHAGGSPARRIALIGETLNDVVSVMVEGVSGLLAIHPASERPRLEISRQRLVWPNGSVAQFYSAESPDALRGPQFAAAWCDEIAKWRHAEEVWDMLQFGLRLGSEPRAVVTTTPRPVPILKRLLQDAATVVSRSRTTDNRSNLARAFIIEMERRYEGTLLGRQELEGELIEDVAGALWRRDWLDEARTDQAPSMSRIVVAVDPPVTSNKSSDACGLIVAGRGVDGRAYVLADRTVQGRAPLDWARAAVAAYEEFEADRIVAEVNQGGELVTTVVRQVMPDVPIATVRATRGKWTRAEPVAALYAEGRVVHVGEHAKLEAQMLAFDGLGRASGRSPDRVDALVWAITELMLDKTARPSLRRL
jgi:phage terminase large subunit-like protein